MVAEIGPDVPDELNCLIEEGLTECYGRSGATEIKIRDNDRKYRQMCICIVYIILYAF